ncbi:MAG: hypothetical protein AAFP84_02985 [Actinomycetota bacterium]
MIDLVTSEHISQLEARGGGPWVSAYFPTDRAGSPQASKTRCKNLLRKGVDFLRATGTSESTLTAIEERAAALLADDDLWATAELGMAAFVAANATTTFRVAAPFDETVEVGDRPSTDLLAPHISERIAYAVLALSLNRVRLFRGDQLGLIEDTSSGLPSSLAEALGTDDREPQLQSHASGRVGSGRTTAAFHGQGSNDDADIERFLREVDRSLAAVLPSALPLVLGGVDRIVVQFRSLTAQRSVVDGSIRGNLDRASPAAIAADAWPLVEHAGQLPPPS